MSDDYRLLNPAAERGPPIRRTEEKGVAFERLPEGDVAITVKGETTVIESNIWASIVLTMTAFNERPNDWHRFMEHHQGTRDILSLGHPWNQKV